MGGNMRLRNKKDGKIEEVSFGNRDGKINVMIGDMSPSGYSILGEYASLAELNEEWEDYKEPLIKDEKIRRAVRSWADLYGYKFVTHRFYTTTTGHRWSLLVRETQEICLPELDGLGESKDYTIAELCGEEEE